MNVMNLLKNIYTFVVVRKFLKDGHYKCAEHRKTFNQWSDIRVHQRIQTAENPNSSLNYT